MRFLQFFIRSRRAADVRTAETPAGTSHGSNVKIITAPTIDDLRRELARHEAAGWCRTGMPSYFDLGRADVPPYYAYRLQRAVPRWTPEIGVEGEPALR